MIELEELIPRARNALKRARNVAAESVSDTLISDSPKRSRSRIPVLSQDSFESDGFLIQIDEIEKNYTGARDEVHDFPQFDVPSFSLGVSQEEKKALPRGVVVVHTQPDSLAIAVQIINYGVEDIIMKCMTTSAQCISTLSLPGTSSCSLPAEFFVAI